LKPGDLGIVQNSRKGKIFVRGRCNVWEEADRVWGVPSLSNRYKI